MCQISFHCKLAGTSTLDLSLTGRLIRKCRAAMSCSFPLLIYANVQPPIGLSLLLRRRVVWRFLFYLFVSRSTCSHSQPHSSLHAGEKHGCKCVNVILNLVWRLTNHVIVFHLLHCELRDPTFYSISFADFILFLCLTLESIETWSKVCAQFRLVLFVPRCSSWRLMNKRNRILSCEILDNPGDWNQIVNRQSNGIRSGLHGLQIDTMIRVAVVVSLDIRKGVVSYWVSEELIELILICCRGQSRL